MIKPNQNLQNQLDPKEQAKIATRDFIKLKKKQMKIQKDNQLDIQKLYQIIQSLDPNKFAQEIQNKSYDFVLSFLFRQNQLRGHTLTNLIKNTKVQDFFHVINKWSVSHSQNLKESISGKISSNELTKIDWRTKFLNFNRQLIKTISKNIDSKQQMTLKIQTLSVKDSLFQLLYVQYLTLDFVKLILPQHNNYVILDKFFIPLGQELQKNNNSLNTYKYLMVYKNNLQQEKVWKNSDFKNSLNHPQVLYLRQLNYNFLHELIRKRNIDEAMALYDKLIQNYESLQKQKQSEQNKIIDIQKIFNVFDNSQETPLDICLRQGSISQIKKILAYAQQKDFIFLSINCINKILSNYKLKQNEVQQLIDRFLSGPLSTKGYIQPSFQTNIKGRFSALKRYKMTFITSFDSNDVILSKDGNNSFPLLTYLKKFDSKCKLSYVLKLLPKLFDRKIFKIKITGLIKLSQGQLLPVGKTQLNKQIEDIFYYYNPVMSYIARIQEKNDIFQFFVNKCFINFFFFGLHEKWHLFDHHFIQQYMLYNKDLSQNDINKDIYTKVFNAKQSQRKIGQVDLYLQIARSFYSLKYRQLWNKDVWMVNKIKEGLKNYINSFGEKQLFTKCICIPKYSLKYPLQNNKSLYDNYLYGEKRNKVFAILPLLYTNEEIASKFPTFLDAKHSYYKQTIKSTRKLIANMYGISLGQGYFISQPAIDDKQINPYNFNKLNKLYNNNRTLKNLKEKIQFFEKLRNTNDESKYDRTMKLQFKINEQVLQQKLIYALQKDYNFIIQFDGKIKDKKPFTHKDYKLFFQRVRYNKRSFFQTLIRTQDQHLDKFQKIVNRSQRLKKMILEQILDINTGTILINIQQSPSLSRSTNFNILLNCINKEWNLQDIRHRIFFEDLKTRISEIQCIKLKILKGYDNYSYDQQEKQLNMLVINGHKFFKENIRTKISKTYDQYAFKGLLSQNLPYYQSQQEQKENKQYSWMINYYFRFFQIVLLSQFHQRAQLSSSIKTFQINELMLNPRFDWLTVRIKASQNLKNDLITVYQKFKYLNNIQTHKKKQIHNCIWQQYIKSFISLSLQDYKAILKLLKSHNIETHMFIINNNDSQKKVMWHLGQLIQWQMLSKKRIALFKKGIPFAFTSLYKDESIILNKNNFTKLNKQKHEINIQAWKKFNQLQKITDQQKIKKSIVLTSFLIDNLQWKYLPDYFKYAKFKKYMIAKSLQIFADDKQYYQKQLKSQEQVQFVKVLKHQIKTNQLKFDPVMFSDLFIINPEMAFEVYSPKQISIDLLIRCLKAHPKKCNLFKKNKVSFTKTDFKQFFTQQEIQMNPFQKRHNYLQKAFSSISYSLQKVNSFYFYDFKQKPWLINLFDMRNQIIETIRDSQNFNKRSYPKKQLFIQEDILKNYKKYYNEQQVNICVNMIFRNSYIKNIKQIPTELIDLYFAKNKQIKNLPLLSPSLIADLIQMNKIDQKYTKAIIQTCNFKLIDMFLSKNKLSFNSNLISKLQILRKTIKMNRHLKLDYTSQNPFIQRKGYFLDFMCKNQNQQFTIQFFKKYNILQSCPYDFQFASSILLKSMCCYRKTKILKYLLDYCQTKRSLKLTFVFNDDCKITQSGLVMLPSTMAVQNHYYEYMMLVKGCQNQIPLFQTSARFLINRFPFDYSFIPEMNRRLKILNAFRQNLPKGSSIDYYYYIMRAVFNIQNNFEMKDSNLPKNWKSSLQNLFSFACQSKFIIPQMGIFQKLLYLIQIKQQTKITQEILISLYPKQMRIINSVRQFSLNQPINYQFQQVFKNDQLLMPLLLKYSAPLFIKHFQNTLSVHSMTSYLYMEGLYSNLVLFETQYEHILNLYLSSCIQSKNINYNYDYAYVKLEKQSLKLVKEQLILAILSISKGQGKSMKIIKKAHNFTVLSDVYALFELSHVLNKRYDNNIIFDAFVWQTVYKALQSSQNLQPSKNSKGTQLAKSIAKQLQKILEQKLSLECKASYQNINQKIQNLLCTISNTTHNDSYVYFTGLITIFKFYCDTLQFFKQLESIKLPLHSRCKIQFVNNKEQISADIQGDCLNIKCDIQILKYHKIQYLSPVYGDLLMTIKHKFYFNQISKQIDSLNNFCSEQNRYPLLKNLKFEYDFEAFKQIKSYQRIKNLVGQYSQDIILKTIQKMEQTSAPNRHQGVYSISDVYGPINLPEINNLNIAIEALSFYEYLNLPNRQQPIKIKYLEKEPTIKQINSLILKDFSEYVTFFRQEILGQHKFNHSINNIIYISDSQGSPQNQKKSTLKIFTHFWSLSNIVSIFSSVNHFGHLINQKFDNTMDVRLSSNSLIILIQQIMKKQKSQSNIINRISKFLNSKRHQQIIQKVLLMIIQDAINIMKVVRGIVITYKILDKSFKKSQVYQIDQYCSLVNFDYQINEQIFLLTVGMNVHDFQNVQKMIQIDNSLDFVSRKQFLDCIFSSTQFLTDYFLNKNILNQQCVKLSTQLSKSYNLHVNVSIDYKSLYEFIQKFKQNSTIRQIDGYLNGLRGFILMSMQNSLNSYMISQQVCLRHQVKIFNTFTSFKTGQHINDVYKKQQLSFGSKIESTLGLIKVDGNMNNLDKVNLIKNMFLVQIFKSHYVSMVTQGMTFVLGYKNSYKSPKIVKLANKNDINQVNIVDLAYLLLVTPRIPTDDQLKTDKIIRIFIADLNGFLYKIDQNISKKLLDEKNQQRDIADIAPMVAPHMVIHFPNQYLSQKARQKDSKQQKVFEIKLDKQRKFKLQPQIPKPITLPNQIKTDLIATSSINQVIQFLNKSFNHNVNLIIKPPKQNPQNVNISQIVKLNLFDLQYSLESYINPSMINDNLQIKLSVQNGYNALQNFYTAKRKQLFLKYFKNIKVQLQTPKSGVFFEKDNMVVRVGRLKSNQIISGQIIAASFVTQLIKKQYQNNNKNNKSIKISQYQNMTKQTTIKALDSLITSQQQLKQAQKGLKICQALGHSISNIKIIIDISLDAWDQIKMKDNNLIIGLKITNSKRDFYNSFQIASFILNQSVIPDGIQNTQYNPQTNNIQVYNTKSQVLSVIYITKDGSMSLKKQKIGLLQNQKNGFKLNQKENILKYCIVQGGNLFWNYIYKIPHRQSLIKSKNATAIINKKIISQISYNHKPIPINTCPIIFSVKRPLNPNKDFVINITQTHKFDRIKMNLYSRNVCQLQIQMPYSCQATLNYPGFNSLYHSGQSQNLNVISDGQLVIQKTKFMQLHFRNKVHQPKKQHKSQQTQSLKMFKEPPQQKKMDQKKVEIKSDDVELMVYTVNDQSKKFLTKAGQQRIDYIQLCDNDGNPVQDRQVHVVFEHINQLAKYQPEQIKENSWIGLKWKPIIRGHYQIYINGICLNPQYEVGVCANVADPNICKAQIPKKTSICFAQQTQCTFELKDNYGNIYTQLEQSLLGDSLLIQMKASALQNCIKAKGSPIDKYGFKKYRFSIDDAKADIAQTITIVVSLNMVDVLAFDIEVKGQALNQRKKLLQKDIDNIRKGHSKQILVSRGRFLEDLFKLAQKSLHTNFSVKFTGQQGIDAGGLKRQFYDMIGRQFKSQRNQFFTATDKRKVEYFLDPQILKNKKKNEYMQLLGKYLANSILNTYLIGVNFSPVFIKLLYQDPITFQDLLTVIPSQQSQRYKYLLKCDQSQFQDLQLYFTTVVDKKKGTQIELVQDGKQRRVIKQNVKQYLQLLSKSLLVDRFKELIQNFRKGFNTVLDLDIVRRWIRPEQFWCITAGVKQITSQIVLNYINFQGGSQMLYAWFRRYISQANQEILVGFLKFASGSGSIDFDQNSKITVTFEKLGQNPKKLPISHTCWKQILIPKYKTYEIMHKLLNAAFLFCSQGFGFG